jgi:hypothetical protein
MCPACMLRPQCWELTSAESWAEFLPWAVNNMPMLQQRVRFIKTFLWAMVGGQGLGFRFIKTFLWAMVGGRAGSQ